MKLKPVGFMGFFILLSLCLGPLSGAQSQLGIKAGLTNAWTDFSGSLPGIQFNSITDFSLGAFMSFGILSNRFSLQPEIHYIQKGFDARETNQGEEISSVYKISYFEIQMLLTYKLSLKGSIKPIVVLGPYLAFPGKVREIQTAFGEREEREMDDNLKNLDTGVVLGFEIHYQQKTFHLILGGYYCLGLTNISRDIQAVSYDLNENDTIKNRSLSLRIGLAFNLSVKK
jgi:hypothetical protein